MFRRKVISNYSNLYSRSVYNVNNHVPFSAQQQRSRHVYIVWPNNFVDVKLSHGDVFQDEGQLSLLSKHAEDTHQQYIQYLSQQASPQQQQQQQQAANSTAYLRVKAPAELLTYSQSNHVEFMKTYKNVNSATKRMTNSPCVQLNGCQLIVKGKEALVGEGASQQANKDEERDQEQPDEEPTERNTKHLNK